MRYGIFVVFLLTFLGLGVVARMVAAPSRGDGIRTFLSVEEFMGARASEGFSRAMEPRPFQFPEDHGPHPGFRTEWWYLTGNLRGPAGTPYGFQFTVFRSALSPESREGTGAEPPPSDWRTNQLYMGHFAVTDGGEGRHHAFESFSRGALGLAGAQAEPFRVWIGNWEISGPVTGERGMNSDIFPLSLRGGQDDIGLELQLMPDKPPVLQGQDGLSQKGPEQGNASYYYAFTRLDASGTLILEGDPVPVTGSAWMDREWSTSALSPDQEGWDWFALQLDDGHDLMYYQLRRKDGSADALSEGIWVDPEGRSRLLSLDHVKLEVLDVWGSGLDGTTYPSGWSLQVPPLGLSLEISPIVPDQEMELTFRYWEGAVSVEGIRDGKPVDGVGYVELTGYIPGQARSGDGRRIGRTGGM